MDEEGHAKIQASSNERGHPRIHQVDKM